MNTLSWIIIFCLSASINAQVVDNKNKIKEEVTPEMKEFSEGNFLQIDQMDVPEGLRRIEDQLKENVIDVTIHSKTHMPIFAQKRPEGYSQNYKKFYGMNIRILPIKGDEDFYSLQMFYFNWTTNKFDKKIVRKISKYNVLNELRMATYEMLLGKKWVLDNKEKIEARNFNRIEAVREVIAQNARLKKKKLKDDLNKQQLFEEAEEKLRERKLIKREDKPKLIQRDDAEKESEEKTPKNTVNTDSDDTDTIDPELTPREKIDFPAPTPDSKRVPRKKIKKDASTVQPEIEATPASEPIAIAPVPDASLPKIGYFHVFANYFQESTDVLGLLETKTDLKYLGAGGKFLLETEKESYNHGMRFGILAGMPIFKEKYVFPIYRSIESEYYISKVLGHIGLFAGFDFTPLYFVNLPSQGKGLQVFENDFLWTKLGVGLSGKLFDRDYELRFKYFKSLIQKSNQTEKFSGTKTEANIFLQVKNAHGAEVNFSTTKVTGGVEVSSNKVGLSYTYKFQN